MRGPSPLYIEERHRALGRDATFSWSRALTHPPRCNRTRHRGRHLGVVGASILDQKSWGPPSWTGSDVKSAIVGPILLSMLGNHRFVSETPFKWRFAGGPMMSHFKWHFDPLSIASKKKKRCQCWTPSDETYWIRAWSSHVYITSAASKVQTCVIFV